MATAEHKPSTGLSVQVLKLYIHEAGPAEGSAGLCNILPLFTPLFPRPGQYLRESTRRGTRKALPSGRLVCAVLSTRVLSLRRFLRMAIGMGLSPTRCIGCCHQEPFLVSVPLPTTPRISRLGRKNGDECPGRVVGLPAGPWVRVLPCPVLGELLPRFPCSVLSTPLLPLISSLSSVSN